MVKKRKHGAHPCPGGFALYRERPASRRGSVRRRKYKHGELVDINRRGVWSMPLLPGKYAFNTYAGKIIIVPTTNFTLKWVKEETGSHKFDENLSQVSLITKDAFEPSLPLSVVVHIDYRKAPLVIQLNSKARSHLRGGSRCAVTSKFNPVPTSISPRSSFSPRDSRRSPAETDPSRRKAGKRSGSPGC